MKWCCRIVTYSLGRHCTSFPITTRTLTKEKWGHVISDFIPDCKHAIPSGWRENIEEGVIWEGSSPVSIIRHYSSLGLAPPGLIKKVAALENAL